MGVVTGNPRFAKPVVLVVDDEPFQQRSLARVFRDLEVHVASGAREALELIRGGLKPDVVLSDIRMPEGTGVDLKTWLTRDHPSLLDRLVFMTAFGPEGAEAVLPHVTLKKPLTEHDIRSVRQRATDNAEA
ncbi:MAG: response regulator [Deltaproteobacteria bacterium]|jgi:CheY-like chemotaxis protein